MSVRDVTIRPERAADHDAIAQVVAAAFGSPAEADLVARIRASPEYVPEMSLVAVVATEGIATDGVAAGVTAGAAAERIVGHVMISGAILRTSSGERSIVMLSPLAVAPDRHGTGIGGALVRAAVAVADRRGEPFVVLEGAPAYYSRFGFRPAAAHGITMPLPDWAPPEAAQILTLREDDPRLQGAVVYPAAFDAVT